MNLHTDNNILEPTKNGFGYMHGSSLIMDEFVCFSKKVGKPVLDIGSAYGIASIKSLEEGAKVIASDICSEHLEILKERASLEKRENLTTIHGRFPDDLSFERDSLSAVLLSHVISFLSTEELELGIKKIYEWLDKDGKLFILNYTPYHRTLAEFIPIYEKRKKTGEKWPGFIEDKRLFSTSDKVMENVPNKINLMDIEICERLANDNNFKIETLRYIGGEEQGVPSIFCLDDREWVGMIARK